MTKRKTVSRSELARELLAAGKLSAAAIAKRTGLSPQTIYTLKWKVAKKQGLGAIKPKAAPVGKGTGITSAPPKEFMTPLHRAIKPTSKQSEAQRARRLREREQREVVTINEIIASLQPKPRSLWQRIKGFFVGA